MTLKELMRIAYNSGYEDGKLRDLTADFHSWWDEYGEVRHDDFIDALDDVILTSEEEQ